MVSERKDGDSKFSASDRSGGSSDHHALFLCDIFCYCVCGLGLICLCCDTSSVDSAMFVCSTEIWCGGPNPT